MTGKRFILVEYVNKGLFIQDNDNDETQYFQGSKASLEKVVDLLNALSDENEQLRHDATILIQSNQDYRRENEQLKEENNQLHQKIFEMRTNIALDRTEISRQTYTGEKTKKNI